MRRPGFFSGGNCADSGHSSVDADAAYHPALRNVAAGISAWTASGFRTYTAAGHVPFNQGGRLVVGLYKPELFQQDLSATVRAVAQGAGKGFTRMIKTCGNTGFLSSAGKRTRRKISGLRFIRFPKCDKSAIITTFFFLFSVAPEDILQMKKNRKTKREHGKPHRMIHANQYWSPDGKMMIKTA